MNTHRDACVFTHPVFQWKQQETFVKDILELTAFSFLTDDRIECSLLILWSLSLSLSVSLSLPLSLYVPPFSPLSPYVSVSYRIASL